MKTDATRREDLRRWQRTFSDVTPIGEAQPRRRATCVGVVHKIRLVPGRCLEGTLEDGSGRLRAVFSGRPRLRGLKLGVALRVEGTIGVDSDRLAIMRNPAWEHVTEPYGV